VFALLGPNGAGKTTTIEILEGFRERDAGEVRVLGIDPGDRRSGRRLRSQLGVVLQELAVEPFLSVRQVLERNAGYYPAPRPVGEMIALIDLAEKADAKVKTLSGGQQRRLDVGLGIVGNPALLFLDEPPPGLIRRGGNIRGSWCAGSPARVRRWWLRRWRGRGSLRSARARCRSVPQGLRPSGSANTSASSSPGATSRK
jgi:ABC-2 type transport system ATP-binding protein